MSLNNSECLNCALFSALQDEPRLLWVDAIYIDQSDADEKNYQVPLMHNIYQRAQSVQVWLGESSDQSEEAMKLIPTIQHTYMLHKIIQARLN